MPDLVNLIADFCNDEALSKLSRVSSDVSDEGLDEQGCEEDDCGGEQGPLHPYTGVQVRSRMRADGGRTSHRMSGL